MEIMKRILLVEDDPNDVELTLAGLAEYNIVNEVVVVRDGEEALDYLCRRGKFAERRIENPALVLLDLKLPKVDGLDVLRTMRSDESLKMIPVVILTSSREDRDIVEGYRLGTNAYVVKPVDFHAFIEAVKHIGVFWSIINEPPPGSIRRKAGH